MKRQQDRDSPVKGKRSHSSMTRYDDSPRDRGTPDRRDRRGVNKSPSDQRRGRTRDPSIERGITMGRSSGGLSRGDVYDEYSRGIKTDRSGGGSGGGGGGNSYPYKILCVTNLNHKVSDAATREALLREFNRFGEVNVKFVHEGSERIGYVYFRTFEDARDAKHAKGRLVLFDKALQIDPVYERGGSGGRRNRSMSPDYGPHGGVRGVSPAHSTASSSSMGRHSGARLNSLDKGGPSPYPAHHREPMRREMHHEFHRASHRRDESKKEKFPNYLHHVPPEEDDKATRTLFVGNLEVTISEAELRRIFERYGVVEDIDVKRPPPGQGNAYAFIKFLNLDMAHRAKVEMSGQYIGKFQCKIGYGKATPTTRIWVGGLGPWTSLSHLEREFDRFGAIRKIDFVKGDNHAYIQYDSIDAAQAACQEMRGFPLGGPDKRLRVDFADPGPYSYYESPSRGTFREEAPEHYAASRRGSSRDIPTVEEARHYGAVDNHWPRNSTYHNNQPYDAHFERPPRAQTREQWQGSLHGAEPDDRRAADYRGGWNRERQAWWEEHPRGGRTDGGSERRKRPRTPEDDIPHDGRNSRTEEGVNNYKRARRSHTPDQDRDRTPNKDVSSPRRSRGDSAGRRTSKERLLPSGSDSIRRSDARESGGRNRERDGDSVYDSGRTRSRRDSDGRDDKKLQADAVVKEGSVAVADSVTNMQDLAKCCPVAWHGGLVLKNSAFPTRMHVCSGDPSLVEQLMKDPSSDNSLLRITQRLRLDVPKLEDVSKRITNAGSHGHCMLLTLPIPVHQTEDQTNSVQQRPLRNLVSYLKQKEAAGVISLPANSSGKKEGKEATGVLYAFPPCSFSLDLLRRIAPNLTADTTKEDHLVVVVVKGSS